MPQYATLSTAECNAIHIAREYAPDAARKAMKKEIFARTKVAFGIPPDHKLVVETDVTKAGAGLLKNKATRETYLLDDNTGKWVNANGTTADKLWFRLPVDMLYQAIVDALDNEEANGNAIDSNHDQPAGAVMNPRYDNIVATQDGSLWIQLDSDAYEERETSNEEEDDDLPF